MRAKLPLCALAGLVTVTLGACGTGGHTVMKPPLANSANPPAHNSTAAITPALPSGGPAHLAPAADRRAAAAILHADDAYYQNECNQGVTVIRARGDGGSYDAFHTWYDVASTDTQPGLDAFRQADSHFTAGDEPSSINDWRNDNTAMVGDLTQVATDGLGVGGPDDAQARQQVQADAEQFRSDYIAAEQDAANVEAGR